MLKYLVLVGAAIQLVGIYAYIKDTLYGNTKPNRVTWLMWSVAPLIATFAALSSGVRLAVLPVFMSGFGPLLVFGASFTNRNAYWKLEKFDYFCGVASLLALILWGITREPIVAILFAILSDGFAAIPTLIKSWNYPDTEIVDPYTTGLFNASTSFFAIVVWKPASYMFPVYLILINSLLISAVYGRRTIKLLGFNK